MNKIKRSLLKVKGKLANICINVTKRNLNKKTFLKINFLALYIGQQTITKCSTAVLAKGGFVFGALGYS